MSRSTILNEPTKVSDLTFDDLYSELRNDWQRKAKTLQVRRWRALKREIKGGF